MPNFLQKWLYNLSAGAPLLLVFAIVWYCEKRIWIVSAVCVGLATLLMVLMLVAFSYGKRNLPPIIITVTDVSPNDAWIVAYIISYITIYIILLRKTSFRFEWLLSLSNNTGKVPNR